MTNKEMIAKLNKTSNSITAYVARGGRGNSSRWYDLADRYTDLKSALRNTEDGNKMYVEWCNSKGFDVSSDAWDFLA